MEAVQRTGNEMVLNAFRRQMITFDFPPLTSEIAAWNDSHKSTVCDVCARVHTSGVIVAGWGKIDM